MDRQLDHYFEDRASSDVLSLFSRDLYEVGDAELVALEWLLEETDEKCVLSRASFLMEFVPPIMVIAELHRAGLEQYAQLVHGDILTAEDYMVLDKIRASGSNSKPPHHGRCSVSIMPKGTKYRGSPYRTVFIECASGHTFTVDGVTFDIRSSTVSYRADRYHTMYIYEEHTKAFTRVIESMGMDFPFLAPTLHCILVPKAHVDHVSDSEWST